jgi:hypothetical protein
VAPARRTGGRRHAEPRLLAGGAGRAATAGNTRFALSIAEKRPFFFESADLLRTPTEAFYTRSFTAPRGACAPPGAAPTWPAARWSDRRPGRRPGAAAGPYGTDAADQPASRTLARAAAATKAPAMGRRAGRAALCRWTRRQHRAGPGRRLGAIDDAWRLRAQWLHARTTAQPDGHGGLARGAPVDGDRLFLRLNRNTESSDSSLTLDETSAGFATTAASSARPACASCGGLRKPGLARAGPVPRVLAERARHRTTDRGSGDVIEQSALPGFWSSAARNLEWWLELHALASCAPRRRARCCRSATWPPGS